MSQPIRTVAVVGRDAPLWLTALALRRFFGRTGVAVIAVELPSFRPEAETYVGTPTLTAMHSLLGLDEGKVLASAAGVPNFAQYFVGWSGKQTSFMHAYDTSGVVFNSVPFLDHWLKARRNGLEADLADFSLGAVAARQGRFVVHTNATEQMSRAGHGYSLDAGGYADILRAYAVRAGVEPLQGPVSDIARIEDRITSLTLAGGGAVTADLFVDTSTEGCLIEAVQNVPFQTWRPYFGGDRILWASAARQTKLPGYVSTIATPAGWMMVSPLQNRTGLTAVFDSASASERDMLHWMSQVSRGSLQGRPMMRPIEPGLRQGPWRGNCVGVGEAAARLEPLDGAALQMAQIGITHLLALFPVSAERMDIEAETYNGAIERHAENIRDFQLAHYKLNGRAGEPFWDCARNVELSPALTHKLDLFAARGRVALYDDETFQEPDWTASLIGHGLIPRSYDPLADMVSDEDRMQQLQGMLGFLADEVAEMPSIEAELEMNAPRSAVGFFAS